MKASAKIRRELARSNEKMLRNYLFINHLARSCCLTYLAFLGSFLLSIFIDRERERQSSAFWLMTIMLSECFKSATSTIYKLTLNLPTAMNDDDFNVSI